MPEWLIPAVRHFAAGDALFVAAGFVLLGMWCGWSSRGSARRWSLRLVITGVTIFLISSAPWPLAIGAVLVVFTLAALFIKSPKVQPPAEPNGQAVRAGQLSRAVWLLVPVMWIVAAAWEFSFRQLPQLSQLKLRTLVVIGDSISAGLGENEGTPWPEVLQRESGVDVRNLAHAGDNVRSALRSLPVDLPGDALILIEIGGNDVLGDSTAREFEQQLDQLLVRVRSAGSNVLMFELPLPPLAGRFGEVQRRMARKHGVTLIPKSVLLEVLLSGETTGDSLHLNEAGHRQLAARVWEIIGPAFAGK